VADESHASTGMPNWSFQLDIPGLRFAPFESPVKIELRDAGTGRRTEWRSARLSESGPDDAVFEFDGLTEGVTFGNGVNGRIPPQGVKMLATYAVSAGEEGCVAINRRWRVLGFAETFGMNVDPVTGGAAATDGIDERREARRRAREDHALVSASDIEQAAFALPLLEVARAWVLPPDERAPRTGTVTLMAMRARRSEEEAGGTPETPRWLEAIRRRLAAKMPLATRLAVVGPRYVEFSVRATIEVAPGRNPADIEAAIERELGSRLALIGTAARRPGVPVTTRDLTAWIRVVEGVRRVRALRLVLESGKESDEIKVPRNGLPRVDLAGSRFEMTRAGAGAVR